ncbi:SusC/RagA family TonB-linked outer membrane protein [Pseudochryseolinea flava]|uniref:SusC/RagA family TonB-linked outer membrane protein n=2 Tax=Pseudochryseolinea flava TaxID=2059302 RepID=A0A364Y9C8_9BACT|nr:SusC/RagA family TonB-linked outer membrane protein [Pseudochryseolinea flava]
MLITVVGYAQQNSGRTISGKVVDENGSGMPGVSISIAGTSTGTQSDADGSYQLVVPGTETVLHVSFIGYVTQDITVGERTSIDITMAPDVTSLQEVVVVGYGVQRKESVVSAVSSVDPQKLKSATGNLTNSLAGRVSGMIAYQTSGEPGLGTDNAAFYIRGLSTFGSGKSDPLILIDNVESTPTDLARLQTDDIASFSVLKDASAAAVYGSRGANGVIIVITKLGVPGKTRFNFRAETTMSSNTRNYKLTDNISYMRDANEAALTRNYDNGVPYSENKIAHTAAGDDPYLYPNNNWLDQLIRDYTINQRYNLNISGGDEKSSYYIAGTYNVDNGILKVDPLNDFNSNIKLKNYAIRSNITVDFTKTTEFILRLYAQFDDYIGPVGGGARTFINALSANPVMFPAVYPKSKLPFVNHPLFGSAPTELATPGQGGTLYINPYAEMVRGYQTYKKSNVNPQIEIKQDLGFITQGLSASAMGYLQRYMYYSVARAYDPFYYEAVVNPIIPSEYAVSVLNGDADDLYAPGTEYLSYYEFPKEVTSKMYVQGSLNYTRAFNKHEFGGLLTGFVSSFESGNSGTVTASLPQRNTVLAGRATYGYDSRYLVEFNFGYNGSERFAKNNRYGFFPSVGVAYNISKEQFFQPITSVVSDLKLRFSYGLVGNDQIGNINDRFFYLSNVNANADGFGARFGDQMGTPLYFRPGYDFIRYGNNNVAWEVSKQTNIGLDFSLFNNELSFIVNAFKTERSNMYLPNPNVESAQGLTTSPAANYGSGETRGVDISMMYNKQISDFNITLSGTFTYSTNKILKTAELQYGPELAHLTRRGHNFSQQWGYIAERLFIDDEEVENSPVQIFDPNQTVRAGDIKYRDITGDGRITPDDMVPIGHPTIPEIIYGIGPSITYKRFDFGFMFQGSARRSFFIDPIKTAPFIEFAGFNDRGDMIAGRGLQSGELQVIHDDHWSEDNRDPYAFWPRLSDQIEWNNVQPSTWWLRNGSFIRLKTVTIGYSFPSIEKLANLKPRVYFSANNLFAISKFDMWDVEMGGNGLGYPLQRVYMLGVQIDL